MQANPPRHRSSFLDRVLDGRTEASDLPAALAAARIDERGRDVERLIGLGTGDIAQVEACLPALRYVLHARRFDLEPPRGLTSLDAVRAHALQIAAAGCDPFELADVDEWAGRRLSRSLQGAHAEAVPGA